MLKKLFLFLALEGYLLYRALVVIFDTGDHRHFPLYIFGYGMPAVIATATLLVALLVHGNEDSSVSLKKCYSVA